jgi:hypothetical protein
LSLFVVFQNVGINEGYLRIQTNLPEVDVPKGTLVRVDPDCSDQSSAVSSSTTVISLDHLPGQEKEFENVKMTVFWKVSA